MGDDLEPKDATHRKGIHLFKKVSREAWYVWRTHKKEWIYCYANACEKDVVAGKILRIVEKPTGTIPSETIIKPTIKGNNTMARIVNVTIIDNSAGIKDDANRLVVRYKDITTTKTDEQVKMEILMTKNVAAKLKSHNDVRSKLIDESILLNTGQEVMLRPVELHELTFSVTNA